MAGQETGQEKEEKWVPLMSEGDRPKMKPLRTFLSAELELSLQKWRWKSKEHQCQAGPGMKLRFSTCRWNHHGCLSTPRTGTKVNGVLPLLSRSP